MTRHDERFVRYLKSKEVVDDRALHRPTMSTLVDELSDRADARPGEPLRVVSVGAGTGAMCRRFLSWGVFDAYDDVKYVMVDRRKGMADRAAAAFAEWSQEAGWEAAPTVDGFQIERHGRRVSLTYVTGDLFDATVVLPKAIDLAIAHAVLDVLPLNRAIESLVSRLTEDGLFYAPITFDGRTTFRPSHNADDEILDAYHDSMEDENSSGAETGSDLLSALPMADTSILSAGGSDWVVHPPYSDEERFFLSRILGFVKESVGSNGGVGETTLRGWLDTRHKQLEAEELTYVAHNLDVLAKLD
ncbi:SAM-dependent methyltransferase [Haloferax sp. S1W]|uniref:SAM-dependent methyltransferase n=1 Tax=Haloferax sp. S1W TaxID=3377110 RepID=UPI0037C894E3